MEGGREGLGLSLRQAILRQRDGQNNPRGCRVDTAQGQHAHVTHTHELQTITVFLVPKLLGLHIMFSFPLSQPESLRWESACAASTDTAEADGLCPQPTSREETV